MMFVFFISITARNPHQPKYVKNVVAVDTGVTLHDHNVHLFNKFIMFLNSLTDENMNAQAVSREQDFDSRSCWFTF